MKNTGSETDTIRLTKSSTSGKTSLSATSLTLAPGASAMVTLTVKAPRNVAAGTVMSVTVTGTSAADGAFHDAMVTRTSVA